MGNFGQNDVAKVLAKHFSFQPLDFCFRKPLKSLTAYLRQFASRKNLKFCEVAYVGFPSLSAVQAGYEATLAEYQAKMMQPDITAAQLEKARNEAKASAYQPDLTAVQLDKTKLETRAAAFQPGTAEAQLEKSKQEAKASAWQSLATAAQGLETEGRFMSNGNLSSTYTDRMSRTLGSLKPDDPWEPSVHLPSIPLPKKAEACRSRSQKRR